MIQSLKKYMENYEKIVGFLGMRYPIFFTYVAAMVINGSWWLILINSS